MTEITILIAYGLLVMVTILLQVLGAMTQLSMGYLMSARDDNRGTTGMVARIERALNNSIVAMTLFAPAVLILVITEQTNPTTLLAAQVFMIARIIYLPVYAIGVPAVRTLAWLAGFLATAVLYFQAL
ncbi:MAPEG family protein [Sulfitobacter sp. THAF37]|uniref:MAPEG family protein n=1 Tax=Sulfitobacter sp. THAF37 TaxID=2587855 RepID=UPI0012678880|nr:MAPEG family protein [Sulfitobacter sp. THAF37]QFT58965.1 MAPEG family protein [Sulfitobacter sp. THAF37]